jgi:hypothetical protein
MHHVRPVRLQQLWNGLTLLVGTAVEWKVFDQLVYVLWHSQVFHKEGTPMNFQRTLLCHGYYLLHRIPCLWGGISMETAAHTTATASETKCNAIPFLDSLYF